MTKDKKIVFEYAEGTPNSILYTGGCTCAKKKSCKNYICLGQSGAGKSTFLDSFIIYLLNQGIHDRKRYRLINELQLYKEKLEEMEITKEEIDNMSHEEIKGKV